MPSPQVSMITEQDIINAGYKPGCVFIQVGNYEDEDNLDIWVKGEIAVSKPWYGSPWRKCKRDEINYHDGWPDESEVITEINQL